MSEPINLTQLREWVEAEGAEVDIHLTRDDVLALIDTEAAIALAAWAHDPDAYETADEMEARLDGTLARYTTEVTP